MLLADLVNALNRQDIYSFIFWKGSVFEADRLVGTSGWLKMNCQSVTTSALCLQTVWLRKDYCPIQLILEYSLQ